MTVLIKTLFVLSISVCFAAATPHPSRAVQQDGANGQNGEDGNPGGDATNGEHGSGQSVHVFGSNQTNDLIGYGFNGGNGGHGGNGIGDAGQAVEGGDGGDGGNGGFATTSWFGRIGLRPYGFQYLEEVRTYAFGGDGGKGGTAGLGANGGKQGVGGNGGDGGFGWTHSIGGRSVLTQVRGGDGGTGFGLGNQAGHGGSAAATATLINNNPDDTDSRRINAILYGGRGGYGNYGANGGNGGNVTFGLENSQFELPSQGNLSLNGTGGNGGGSTDGMAGKGGNSLLDLATLFRDGSDTGSSLTFGGRGGDGGNGFASRESNVSGGAAGHAGFRNTLTEQPANITGINIGLMGGDGGDATGELNTGNGADGGVAFVDKTIIRGDWVVPMSFATQLTGGNGGNAFGSGNGGNGASVNLVDRVSVDASINRINLGAKGGNGGNGNKAGNGGDAFLVSNRAFTNSGGLLNGIGITLTSIGGRSGLGTVGQHRGGHAHAEFYQATHTGSTITGTAIGGQAFGGQSGNSTAKITGISFGGFNSHRVTANAFRVDAYMPETQVEAGSNGLAEATSINYGDGFTLATARAQGGFGMMRSGNSRAVAVARNFGRGGASSFAFSDSRADRSSSSINNATSITHASSNVGDSFALSESKMLGHFNLATSRAHIRDTAGSALSRAESRTLARAHSTRIESQLDLTNGRIAADYTSSAQSSYRQSEMGSVDNVEAALHVIVNPHPVGVSEFVLGNNLIENTFQNGGNKYYSNVLGLGSFHAGYSDTLLQADLRVRNSARMFFTLDDRIQTDDDMLLGLFNARSTGNGFDELEFTIRWDRQDFISETFTDVNDALAFFNENIFDVETLTGTDNFSRQFDITMNFRSSGEMDSFGFDFIFGDAILYSGAPIKGPLMFNAVPEPSTLIFVSIFFGAMCSRRRRTNSQN